MQIEESAGTPNKFIVLRQEVLVDQKLNVTEKIVYARICTFDVYFESAEKCAEILGLSKRQVEESKRKLEKAGYIECLANTGRGKQFRAVYDLQKNVSQTYNEMYVRPTTKCMSDLQKNVNIDKRLDERENNNGTIVPLGESAEHGNPDINQMFKTWQEVFGFEQKQSAENRRACYNLIRKKGVGKDNLVQLIRLLAEAQRDRYAPREVRAIVGFASLQSNLPHLMMWGRRKYSQAQGQKGIEI